MQLKHFQAISDIVSFQYTLLKNLKTNFLAIAVKTYAKAAIKVFWLALVLLDFFTFWRVFCHSSPVKVNLFS